MIRTESGIRNPYSALEHGVGFDRAVQLEVNLGQRLQGEDHPRAGIAAVLLEESARFDE